LSLGQDRWIGTFRPHRDFWAWLNYSWFASAYDNDDWVFRVAAMVQMVGMIVNALTRRQ
jgi:low temperature requirement protein LtrA